MGHYASSCPRADGPKLRAARIVDDREEAAEVEIELDPEEDPGPAQLEPELEDQTLDDEGQWAPDHEYSELDDYPDGSQYEEGDMDAAFEEGQLDDSGDDVVWFGGRFSGFRCGDSEK